MVQTLDDIRKQTTDKGQEVVTIGDTPIDEIKLPDLKKFCDENGIETTGNRSKRSTFLDAITAYLDQPVEASVTTVASREICKDDFEIVGLLMAQTIVITAIVLWKIGSLLGRSLAEWSIPIFLEWKNRQNFKAMGDRLRLAARASDPTINIEQYTSNLEEKI